MTSLPQRWGDSAILKLPSFLQPDPDDPPGRATFKPAPPNTLAILLVDDEPAFRSLLAATLKMDGYHVVEACDGEEAVAAIQKVQRVDLVVTDIRMPHVDGITLARTVRRAQPGVPVLFITGYPDDLGVPVPNSSMLSKPFLRDDLMKAVHGLIYTT
jgi:two-component system cell cycle sensor histidine kinase/response regulator CckA